MGVSKYNISSTSVYLISFNGLSVPFNLSLSTGCNYTLAWIRMHKETLSSMRVIYGLESFLSCEPPPVLQIRGDSPSALHIFGRIEIPHRGIAETMCTTTMFASLESDDPRHYYYERDENFCGYRNIGLRY